MEAKWKAIPCTPEYLTEMLAKHDGNVLQVVPSRIIIDLGVHHNGQYARVVEYILYVREP